MPIKASRTLDSFELIANGAGQNDVLNRVIAACGQWYNVISMEECRASISTQWRGTVVAAIALRKEEGRDIAWAMAQAARADCLISPARVIVGIQAPLVSVKFCTENFRVSYIQAQGYESVLQALGGALQMREDVFRAALAT